MVGLPSRSENVICAEPNSLCAVLEWLFFLIMKRVRPMDHSDLTGAPILSYSDAVLYAAAHCLELVGHAKVITV